jgi:hypothetical protein
VTSYDWLHTQRLPTNQTAVPVCAECGGEEQPGAPWEWRLFKVALGYLHPICHERREEQREAWRAHRAKEGNAR